MILQIFIDGAPVTIDIIAHYRANTQVRPTTSNTVQRSGDGGGSKPLPYGYFIPFSGIVAGLHQ